MKLKTKKKNEKEKIPHDPPKYRKKRKNKKNEKKS